MGVAWVALAFGSGRRRVPERRFSCRQDAGRRRALACDSRRCDATSPRMVEELAATHLFANAWDFFVERDGTKIERLNDGNERCSFTFSFFLFSLFYPDIQPIT